ncbi:hypothetical protein UYO_3249, partial [Lachnospiraceae bacterium JC7]
MTLGDKLFKILIYGGSWKTILGGLRVTIQILFLALVPRPDFIILDPPRDGIHPKVIKKIIDYGVDKLIYVA